MKELNVYFLKDIEEGCVDAVIITTHSKIEVQEILNEVREMEDFEWSDIVNALSNDCMMFDRWSNESIYY